MNSAKRRYKALQRFAPERRFIGWSPRVPLRRKLFLAAEFILIFTIGFNHHFLNSVVLDLNIFFR